MHDELGKIARAEAEATHRLGRVPAEWEPAEESGLGPARLAYLRRLPAQCVSLGVVTAWTLAGAAILALKDGSLRAPHLDRLAHGKGDEGPGSPGRRALP
ncbi:hypothetical protein [Nonomuraea sp. NPDC049141]|uniref:hypothetical protein n=1 Tax=Nonomuraea sp. NPDC049141 TaxID=3155500 RepID=UPI003404FE37